MIVLKSIKRILYSYLFFVLFFNFSYSDELKKIDELDIMGVVSYSKAVEKAAPAVVSIQTSQDIPLNSHPMFADPIFRFFFGEPKEGDDKPNPNQRKLQQGLGSGVIIDERGYVLTNNHVIKDATSITVKLYNGTSIEAEIIGTDHKTDLAILKLRSKDVLDIPVIKLGNSDKLKVGDVVLAIGNPFGFDNTVTQGIISALGSISARSNDQYYSLGGWLDTLIQTDAAINPGNSGGALIDVYGNLIGINMAIITRSGGSQGIGFAIPINLAKDIMDQLIKTGYIVRGWLGAQLTEVSKELREHLGFNENCGVYVQAVIRNSPAHKAGILAGDIILKVNNFEVRSVNEAIKLVGSLQPNKHYSIEVFRKFRFLSFYVLIGQVPKEH